MDSLDFSDNADATLERILEAIEKADEDYLLDTDFIEGVLNVSLDTGEEFIINKHEASEQIWLSSPISGGSHFSFDAEAETWIDSDNNELFDVLKEEFQDSANITLKI